MIKATSHRQAPNLSKTTLDNDSGAVVCGGITAVTVAEDCISEPCAGVGQLISRQFITHGDELASVRWDLALSGGADHNKGKITRTHRRSAEIVQDLDP